MADEATLHSELAALLPKHMHIPEPLAKLYDWIEHNGWVQQRAQGGGADGRCG